MRVALLFLLATALLTLFMLGFAWCVGVFLEFVMG